MRKKIYFISVVSVFSFLLLPIQSFTLSTDNNNTVNQNFGLYLSGQYKPGISHFKNFSIKETTKDVHLFALKNDVTNTTKEALIKAPENFNRPYTAQFKNSFTSFSGAVGYHSNQRLRLELEGSYEKFDIVSCKNCAVKDANKFFALARGTETSNNQPKNNESQGLEKNKKSFFTFMKNNGISIASVMINGCYDLSNNTKISSYVCGGIGGDFIEFFDLMHVKFSYQGKLGISYLISPSTSLFVDGYYHRVINNKFKNLHVTYAYPLKDQPTTTSAIAQVNIGYFGGEVGLRFIL